MKLDVTKTMANATEKMSEGAFQQAGSMLSQARNIVREQAQEKSSPEIKKILKKLQTNEQISAGEVALIKAWIVGDAAEYTKMENNFQDWMSEYDRLRKSLAVYENKDCSFEELLTLHGILEDATRISYDIANFLEHRERILKFESAVGDGIDADERDTLINILIGKLQSPQA